VRPIDQSADPGIGLSPVGVVGILVPGNRTVSVLGFGVVGFVGRLGRTFCGSEGEGVQGLDGTFEEFRGRFLLLLLLRLRQRPGRWVGEVRFGLCGLWELGWGHLGWLRFLMWESEELRASFC